MSLKYYPFKLLIIAVLIIRTLIVIRRTSWIIIWISLEINMLRFVPIIFSKNLSNEIEAGIKYFLVQALGSNLILISRIIMWYTLPLKELFPIILFFRLMMKLGLIPFHFWYPSMISNLRWLNCFILSTWQKLGPLIVLIYVSVSSPFLKMVAVVNTLMGGFLGINQSKLRSMMAYSSINHLGWITALFSVAFKFSALIYFSMYVLIILPIFISFHVLKLFYVSFNLNGRRLIKLTLFLGLLSLRGVPPLRGFIPKWMAINLMWRFPVFRLMLIFGSILRIYFYLSAIFSIYMRRTSISLLSQKKGFTVSRMFMLSTSTLLVLPFFFFIYAMTLFYKS